MGICVKGMYLPTSCYFCPMTNDGFYLCKANNPYKHLEDDCEEKRPDWCPIIEVPEPHGRLINADALDVIGYCGIPQGCEDTFDNGVMWLAERIDELPTIIPAEEAEL